MAEQITIHSRKDALTLLHNQLLQDLVTAEFNIKGLEGQQSLSMTIDPQLTQIIKQNKALVTKLQASIAIAYKMLQEEEKQVIRGEEKN